MKADRVKPSPALFRSNNHTLKNDTLDNYTFKKVLQEMKGYMHGLRSPLLSLVALLLLWTAVAGCFPAAEQADPVPQPLQPAKSEATAGTEQASVSGAAREDIQGSVQGSVQDTEGSASGNSQDASPSNGPSSVETGSPPSTAAAGDKPPAGRSETEQVPQAAASTATDTPVPDSAIFEELDLLEDSAFGYLKEMAEGLGPRTSGTDLEKEAGDFLLQRFEDLGYSTEIQEFSLSSTQSSLKVTAPTIGDLETNTLSGTANGEASAQLVFVSLGKPEDFPEEGITGKIALIERGEITFGSKVAQAEREGAVAAIIFNNAGGNFQGTLGGPSRIPAVSLSREHGRNLMDSLNEGNEVEATVAVVEEAIPSRNVIAEIPGASEGVVIVGAHFDTVPDSIGASDNASGIGVLLTVAERMADRSLPFTLRFIAFGAEETGLHGSDYYVESLSQAKLEDIHLMINLDSVGSGTGLRIAGDRWAVNHMRDTAQREDVILAPTGRRGSGGSDHVNFRNAWVPVIFLLADDLSRINSPADTMEHINPQLLGHASALVLDLLENVHTLSGYGP